VYIVIKKGDEAIDEYNYDEDVLGSWITFTSWLMHKGYIRSGYSIEFK
jgi:hypothetical protein